MGAHKDTIYYMALLTVHIIGDHRGREFSASFIFKIMFINLDYYVKEKYVDMLIISYISFLSQSVGILHTYIFKTVITSIHES